MAVHIGLLFRGPCVWRLDKPKPLSSAAGRSHLSPRAGSHPAVESATVLRQPAHARPRRTYGADAAESLLVFMLLCTLLADHGAAVFPAKSLAASALDRENVPARYQLSPMFHTGAPYHGCRTERSPPFVAANNAPVSPTCLLLPVPLSLHTAKKKRSSWFSAPTGPSPYDIYICEGINNIYM